MDPPGSHGTTAVLVHIDVDVGSSVVEQFVLKVALETVSGEICLCVRYQLTSTHTDTHLSDSDRLRRAGNTNSPSDSE